MMIVVSDELEIRAREMARTILITPFTKRTWSELLFLVVGIAASAPLGVRKSDEACPTAAPISAHNAWLASALSTPSRINALGSPGV